MSAKTLLTPADLLDIPDDTGWIVTGKGPRGAKVAFCRMPT